MKARTTLKPSATPAATAVHEVLRSPGRPLPVPLRHEMESRLASPAAVRPSFTIADLASAEFTQPDDASERAADAAVRRGLSRGVAECARPADFSQVRVHTDAAAALATKALDARAFAIGSHVAFADGEFAPHRESGRRLLAHELAHTLQPGSERRVARQKVGGYETAPVNFERADIEKMLGMSYWVQKVGAQYSIMHVNAVQSRFSADAEERDAVLAVLWQRRPASPVASDTVITASIPPRAGAAKSKTLLYRFTFQPPPQKGALEVVRIEFKAEDAQAVVSAAPAPPAGYTPPTLSKDTEGFPEGSDKYWQAHPEEHKQLYAWIQNAPGPRFDQIVTTSESPSKGKKHDSTYQVQGSKDAAAKLTQLKINLLGETPTFIENPPAGYGTRDATDLELEKMRAKTADKLGQVNALSALPADEQLSVKYVIWQYFNGGTRNKEVDVVVPIASKTKRVLYTLRFRPTTNDVDVERVGEEGSSARLTANALNITRVEGFAANSTDPAAFKAWIAKRYPGVTLQGTTLPELQDSVNKAMAVSAGTAVWFKTNYGIEILDAAAAETRLQTTHKRTSDETANLKAFSSDDLKRLEFALETMGDPELQIAKGTQMARQDVLIEIKGKIATPDPKTGGITWQHGTEKTIIIFDSVSTAAERLFIGGTAGVRFSPVQTYVHEFGHVFAEQAKLQKPFDDFVKKKSIKPITWYASSKPVTESFPEAFAIYRTDPEWMKTNLPDLFTWFETVKSNGKPPATP